MVTLIYCIVVFIAAWKLGRKYQDFQDLMLARRVSKLVQQREQIQKEVRDSELYDELDGRITKLNKKIEGELN